jgi:hypothetical protein
MKLCWWPIALLVPVGVWAQPSKERAEAVRAGYGKYGW